MRTHFIVATLSASVIAAPLPEEHHDVPFHHAGPVHATHPTYPHANYSPYESAHEYAYKQTPEYHAYAYPSPFEHGHDAEHFDPHSGYRGLTEHDTGYGPEHGHGFISDLRHGLFT